MQLQPLSMRANPPSDLGGTSGGCTCAMPFHRRAWRPGHPSPGSPAGAGEAPGARHGRGCGLPPLCSPSVPAGWARQSTHAQETGRAHKGCRGGRRVVRVPGSGVVAVRWDEGGHNAGGADGEAAGGPVVRSGRRWRGSPGQRGERRAAQWPPLALNIGGWGGRQPPHERDHTEHYRAQKGSIRGARPRRVSAGTTTGYIPEDCGLGSHAEEFNQPGAKPGEPRVAHNSTQESGRQARRDGKGHTPGGALPPCRQ